MSSSTTSPPRPVTSKSRGTCRYYNAPRGCFAGNNCKFLHGEPVQELRQDGRPMLTPFDQAKECRYYQRGFCKRGDLCWFKHVRSNGSQASIREEEEELCSVCFEKPVTFGLLEGCNHIFCIGCIRKWRDPSGKPGDVVESGNTKKCPMCRTPSRFITPSSIFRVDGEKSATIKAYQSSMGRVPCCYFQKSQAKNKNKPLCPFGKDCFYRHVNEDGSPFEFQEGVDVSMRRYRSGNRMEDSDILPSFFPFLDSLSLFETEGVNLAISRLDSSALRNSQQRNIESLRPANDGVQDSGIPAATRRLREVGQSLEMLNNAIYEGATLEALNVAVEALRMGLGRLGGGQRNGSHGGVISRRHENSTEDGVIGGEIGEEDYEEDEVMERLETLADQMLASINDLRQNPEMDQGRSDTSPPLDPIDRTVAIETPLPRLIPDEAFFRPEGNFGGSEFSDDSMPTLRSVSNSSDSDYDESDEEDEANIPRSTRPHPHDLRFDAAGSRRTEGATTRRGGRSHLLSFHNNGLTSEVGPSAMQRTVAEDRGSGWFSRVVGREQEQQEVVIDIDEEEGLNDEEIFSIIPARPPVSVPVGPIPSTTTTTTVPTPEPPFVTDGRGRVVWTSPRGNGSSELIVPSSPPPREMPSGQRAKTASTNGEFTTDGRGRVIGTSSEAIAEASQETTGADVGSPRRSLLGRMIDAFF